MAPPDSLPLHTPAHASQRDGGSPATPRQLAYLSYMGMTIRGAMSEARAAEAIRTLEDVENYEQWRQLVEKKSEWHTDRFLLHPELFSREFKAYYQDELPDILTSYVRSQSPEAAKLITPLDIRETMEHLSAQNTSWWRSPRRQHLFLMELIMHHPALKAQSSPEQPSLLQGLFRRAQQFFSSVRQSLRSLWSRRSGE